MTAALLALALAAPPGGKYWVFLGTYTAKDASRGIYRCEFDAATGTLSDPQLAAELTSPSFVTLRPDGKVLYAVGETGGKDGGGVFAFGVDAKTGTLTKLDESTSGGAGPCHCVTSPDGSKLLVANYGGGSWKLFELTEEGKFGVRTASRQLVGFGHDRQRQEKPHAHCGAFGNDGTALVVDLGTDQVRRFRYTEARNKTETDNLPAIKLPPGSGPRHIALDPTGDLAFVCGELDSTLNVVRLGDKPEAVQSVSTLPGGKPVKGNSTAEVVRHPSGKFVYVSNRGHNSVAAFGWDGQKLTPLGHATAGIKVPRNFNLSPDGEWMLVANQDGNDVAVFKVGADGLPTPTGTTVKVGKPVCVKFLASRRLGSAQEPGLSRCRRTWAYALKSPRPLPQVRRQHRPEVVVCPHPDHVGPGHPAHLVHPRPGVRRTPSDSRRGYSAGRCSVPARPPARGTASGGGTGSPPRQRPAPGTRPPRAGVPATPAARRARSGRVVEQVAEQEHHRPPAERPAEVERATGPRSAGPGCRPVGQHPAPPPAGGPPGRCGRTNPRTPAVATRRESASRRCRPCCSDQVGQRGG